MHANVLVSVLDEAGFTVREEVCWKVEITAGGETTLFLQDIDAEGHMPAGDVGLELAEGQSIRIAVLY